MKNFILLISILVSLTAVKPNLSFAQARANQLIYKIIDVTEHTFGYDIYKDGKLLIHQPTIPTIAGSKGFITKDAAEKVAQLVLNKIKKGEMPPTITIQEIQAVKVLN